MAHIDIQIIIVIINKANLHTSMFNLFKSRLDAKSFTLNLYCDVKNLKITLNKCFWIEDTECYNSLSEFVPH